MNSPAIHDPDTEARAMRLRQMMDAFLANQTPQDRDRMMQLHLAQARGPVRNGDLLRASVARDVRTVAAREGREILVDDPLIETLRPIAGAFEDTHIPYAISGSLATSIHGEPISSREVEFFVDASPDEGRVLLSELSTRFASVDPGFEGLPGSLRISDNCTLLTITLSFVHDEAFLRSCIARRQAIRIGSGANKFCILRIEDVILVGLKIHNQTRSPKQWDRALSLAKFKEARMDWRHLFKQARALGVDANLICLRDEAGI